MERIKNQPNIFGYNVKEKAHIYIGTIMGAVAPIVGARYLLSVGFEPENWVGEAIAWGGALLINVIPMVKQPHLPIPIYTGMAGAAIGNFVAQKSKGKRNQKNLEKMSEESLI